MSEYKACGKQLEVDPEARGISWEAFMKREISLMRTPKNWKPPVEENKNEPDNGSARNTRTAGGKNRRRRSAD